MGGAGFYFHTLLYGPPAGPPSVEEVRTRFEKEMGEVGPQAMFQKLQEIDPEYAATITFRDRQKIVRGLEIMALTGQPASQLSWKVRSPSLEYDYRCWFIHRPRLSLYQRVEERCEEMLRQGLLEEVEALEKRGLRQNSSAAQAIGYRQCLEYLASPRTPQDYEKLIQEFKLASRHYVKRQFTWFRREPLFRWINVEMHDPEVLLDMLIQECKH